MINSFQSMVIAYLYVNEMSEAVFRGVFSIKFMYL